MRTVAQLKEAGYRIVPAQGLTGVTEISSIKPFWFYNRNFYTKMAEVRENLKAADKFQDGRFVLHLSGLYEDEQIPAYNLIDEDRKKILDEALSRYVTAQNDAQRAAADYEDALNTAEPYTD